MRVRLEKSNWRLAVIGLFLVTGVAVGGVAAGFAIFSDNGGSGLPAMPTTGDYVPISIAHPQNSAIGFINSFSWVPPAGMTIVNVSGSSSGHCELLAARISCDGVNLKPPTCTCRDDG